MPTGGFRPTGRQQSARRTTAAVTRPCPCGVFWRILPFVEQGNIATSGGIDTANISGNAVITQVVKLYLCPANPSSSQGTLSGRADIGGTAAVTNYKGCIGSYWGNGEARWINLPASLTPFPQWQWGLAIGNGIFYRGDIIRHLTTLGVTDGTSNTFMIGEDLPGSTIWNAWAYSNTVTANTSIGPNNKRLLSGALVGSGDWPNNFGFKSNHPTGLHFALADGSVRFINENIDLVTYPRSVPRMEAKLRKCREVIRITCTNVREAPIGASSISRIGACRFTIHLKRIDQRIRRNEAVSAGYFRHDDDRSSESRVIFLNTNSPTRNRSIVSP